MNHNEQTARSVIARGLAALLAWLHPSSAKDARDANTQPADQTDYPLSIYHEKIAKHGVCRSCREDFPITVGELTWLAMKGFPEFKHCQRCRRLRRASLDAQRAA